MERWQIVKAVAGSGKAGPHPRGFVIQCRSCWKVPPKPGNNGHTGLRFRVYGDAWAVLDEWAVHLADCHPDVSAPCLSRLSRGEGARERVRARREREELENAADDSQFWYSLLSQVE